ncbi:hypothetical protein PCV68_001011 [Staphylococcus pseudintermedius]|nr:hypothetical protein [Staphylococcus pseudintermedius]
MKIKVKKEIKLLELFEYIKKNEIADKVFFDNKGKGKVVVGDDRYLYMTDLNLTDTFTVEVEEELNMETDIPVLIELNRGEFHFHYDSFLRGEKNCNSDAFYILNNDMTMTLLWTRNGGLVE